MRRAPAVLTALCLCMLTFGAGAARAGLASHASAPAFRVRDVEGARIELASLLAHGPVVIDFWATWCPPCVQAMPSLLKLSDEFAPAGVTVVGVSMDGPRSFARVQPFARRMGLKFPIVRDEDGALQAAYQVVQAPTTFVIARDGRVAAVLSGWRAGQESELRALVASLTAAPDSAK